MAEKYLDYLPDLHFQLLTKHLDYYFFHENNQINWGTSNKLLVNI